MKIKLILTLILTLGFVGNAVYAEGDAIKFYGSAHASLDSLDDGKDSKTYISSNTSKFGLKGELELNVADLTAIYQIESHVNLDETGKTFASRNSFVGLKGAFGLILAGRHDTPFKMVGSKTQKLFINQIGDYRNITGIGGAGFDLRPNNVIAYGTPNMSGATALVAYVAEDGTNDADAVSAHVMYKYEKLKLALGYETHGKGLTSSEDEEGNVILSAESESGIRASLQYKVAGLTLEVLHEILKDTGGVSGADKDTTGGSVGYKINDTTLKATLFSSDGYDKKADSGATMFAVGVEQKLSDKTKAYINYAATDNDNSAKFRISGGGHGDKVTPITGKKASGISIGLVHNF